MSGPLGTSGGGALPTLNANEVLAGPTTGSPAKAAGRALVADDIPDLSGVYSPVGHTHGGGGGDPSVILSPDDSADNVVQPTTATVVPITIKGAASQTADLQKWTDSAGADVASVAPDGSVEIDDAAAYYIGDKTADGSWRFILSGSNLKMQRRESGTWVEKAEITA